MTDATGAGNDLNTLTPTQAAEKLDTLTADKSWQEKYLSSDLATLREFESLTAAKLKADRIDDALAGTLVPPEFEAITGDEIPSRQLAQTITEFREVGVDDQ